MRWGMLISLFWMLWLALPGPAYAHHVDTPLSVCVAADRPGYAAAMLFADPARFDCTTPQTRWGTGDFWLLSGHLPSPDAIAPDAEVRFGSVWMDRATIYILYADGVILDAGFTSRTAGRNLRLGATLAVAIPRRDVPPVRLLWHVEGAANLRGLILGPVLSDPNSGVRREIRMAALFGGFGGMALALIVYNLALWAALRQRFQPTYCLLLLMLLCYAASSSGVLCHWFPWLDNNDRQRLSAVLLGGSAAAAIGFARTFFEPAVFRGMVGRASTVVIVGLVAASSLFAIAAPWQVHLLDRILAGTYVVLMALIPLILWRAWRVRSNYLWLFALAWGVPILLAGLRIGSAFDLVPWSNWLDHSTILSMALEAMLSSMAVAYRIKLLSRERDRARERELAARLLADTDPLTGLLNRRAFLNDAIGRPGEQALMIVDLDHFKQVNETIGHDGGDEVLRAVARVLTHASPEDALVARIGGEEFAIVADVNARVSPASILQGLRSVSLPFDMTVTASIGTCRGPLAREADWKLLYRRADEALFAAKAAGRDRIRHAPAVGALAA